MQEIKKEAYLILKRLNMEFKPKNTSNVTFRLADGIRKRAEVFADVNNTTLSEVLRYALKSLLNKSNA